MRRPCENEGGGFSDASERRTKDWQWPPEIRRGKEGPYQESWEALPTPWFWTSGFQDRGAIHFCCFKAHGMRSFLTAALGNLQRPGSVSSVRDGWRPKWRQSWKLRGFPGGWRGSPLQDSCVENPMDRGAWRAAVHGVTKSWTRLSNEHTHTGGFPGGSVVQNPACQWRRHRFDPWSRKIPHLNYGATKPMRHNSWAHMPRPLKPAT